MRTEDRIVKAVYVAVWFAAVVALVITDHLWWAAGVFLLASPD